MSGYGADANPFADTSRTANPFSLDNSSAFSLDGMGNPASSSNPTNAAGVNIQAYVSDHDKRAAELERKQRELEQRERDLAQREQDIAQYKSNWPPFAPILVHDIKLVPQEHQRNARLMYYYWLVLAATLLFNFLACLFGLFGGRGVSGVATSAAYLVFITILSFVLWYYPVYTGWCRINKRGAAILFYMYFIFGGFHVLYSVWMLIGVPDTGSAGLWFAIAGLTLHSGAWNVIASIFAIVASVGWVVEAIGGAVLFKLVWNFKNNNAEINWANAKTEFTGLKTLFNLFRKTQK